MGTSIVNTVKIHDDFLALTKHTDEFGVGSIPPQELPTRPSTTTPQELEQEYAEMRGRILEHLAPLLKVNADIKGFCSDPEAVLRFSIAEEHRDRLYTRQYPLADVWTNMIKEVIERWKKAGKVIRAPPGCRYNSPLLAVPKKDKDGKLTGCRVCIDLRQVNKYLVENDRFQIPFIPDMLKSLANKSIFAQVDCSEAYFQWKTAEGSQEYTAFTWQGEQWMFAAAPFGIKPMPSLFQRFISRLFADMPFVVAYIDNIAWGSRNWEEHLSHGVAIMERLNSVNLRIKPDCVSIGQSQIALLGHVINAKGVGIDPEKRDTMMNWKPPAGGEGLASFLGLGTYLRDHVRHYADITAPLEAAKKRPTIDWENGENENLLRHFNLVKRAFANAPFLVPPDFSKPFVVATDASQLGLGGVLYQPDDEAHTITKDNIVAICSHQLNATQQRYPVYKKELWALVYCLRKFHSYIYGKRNVYVYTDHKPLVYILHQKTMAQALQQYVDVIMDYDLIITYRPGILHILPDALSRMFTSTYDDDSVTWGTVPNVRFLDNFAHNSKSSDFICQQSIDDVTPVKVLTKRHRPVSGQGEERVESVSEGKWGEQNENDNDNEDNIDNNNNEKATVSFCAEPNAGARSARGEGHRSETLYEYGHEQPEVASITDNENYEFDHSFISAPFFAASEYNLRQATLTCNALGVPVDQEVTKEAQAEEERTLKYEEDELKIPREDNDLHQPSPNMDKEGNRAKLVKDKLTEEEKLLVAQNKRGKKVPSTEEKKKELVVQAHMRGHYGEKAMLAYLDRLGYWWPRMREGIKAEITACQDCQRFSTCTAGFQPARSITASLPGDHYQVDLAQLPTSVTGFNYLLILVDLFTGFIVLKPMQNKLATTTATAIWEIMTLIGIPRRMQSDNGTEFDNALFRELKRLVGVPHLFITPWNPRCDGKVERTVQAVKATLVRYLKGATALWPLYVPFVQLMYNNKVQELTGSTPFSLMFGRALNEMKDYTKTPAEPITQDTWKEHQDKIVSLILPAINKRIGEKKTKQRAALDKTRKLLVTANLKAGSIVMIKDAAYLANPSMRPSTAPLFVGPYVVVAQAMDGPYSLKDDTGTPFGRKVPRDHMKVLFTAGDRVESGVESAEKKGQSYEIDELLNDRNDDGEGATEYLVKWKGCDKKKATWEPSTMFNDYACIEKYWKQKMLLKLQKEKEKQEKSKANVAFLFYSQA